MYIPEGVHLRSYLGFLGGTIGVVGTLLTYEKARFKVTVCSEREGGSSKGEIVAASKMSMMTHNHACP
jgi:hypothetical protein